MRIIALALLVLCISQGIRAGEKYEQDELEARLQNAVACRDDTFFSRAGLKIILLAPNTTMSFGTALSYSDIDVGQDNYLADSEVVVKEMMEIMRDEDTVAIVCLAWHYLPGQLIMYGGYSYGTEAGMNAVSPSGSALPSEN